MLTKLPESGAVPVILVSTGERATAIRCDDAEGFHIVLPRTGDGEGGCIGGRGPDMREGAPYPGDWIVWRADGCVIGVKAGGAVAVADVEAAK